MSRAPEGWLPCRLSDVVRHKSGNSKLIKGKLSPAPAAGLFQGFSASGPDVWCPAGEHEGSAIIVSAVGARCGKAFKADGRWSAIANTHIVWPSDAVDRDYLFYQLNDEKFWERGGSAQPFVKVAATFARPWTFPPLSEQRRIVAKLEALQARSRRAREALEAVPPLLEKLRQSILAAAFRGDLTKDWRAKHPDVEPASELLKRIRVERRKKWEEAELAKMKAKGKVPGDDRWKQRYKEPVRADANELPGLSEGWCWATIDELAQVGTGATPKRGEGRYYSGGTIAWVTSGALNEGVVATASEFVTPIAPQETNLSVYPSGTLLMAMYGEGRTRGTVAELRIPAATNQAIAAICFGSSARALSTLVKLALEQKYAAIRAGSEGGVQPNLNLEKVRAIAVPISPVEESGEVEAAVRRAAERVAQVTSASANGAKNLERLNRALLADAFRGALVAQDPDEVSLEPMPTVLGRHIAPSSSRRRSSSASGTKDSVTR